MFVYVHFPTERVWSKQWNIETIYLKCTENLYDLKLKDDTRKFAFLLWPTSKIQINAIPQYAHRPWGNNILYRKIKKVSEKALLQNYDGSGKLILFESSYLIGSFISIIHLHIIVYFQTWISQNYTCVG